MRERLERAIRQGLVLSAALGGCSSEQSGDTGGGGTGGTSATTGGHAGKGGTVLPGDAGTAGAGKVDDAPGGGGQGGSLGDGLLPYPQQAYPLCSGENYGGESNPYAGQCCIAPRCIPPENGECPVADMANFGLGSGDCGCMPDSGKAVEGPFAPRTDDEATTRSCCYLVAAIGCTGRPLLVAGAPRVAGATRRSDWASRSSWA